MNRSTDVYPLACCGPDCPQLEAFARVEEGVAALGANLAAAVDGFVDQSMTNAPSESELSAAADVTKTTRIVQTSVTASTAAAETIPCGNVNKKFCPRFDVFGTCLAAVKAVLDEQPGYGR